MLRLTEWVIKGFPPRFLSSIDYIWLPLCSHRNVPICQRCKAVISGFPPEYETSTNPLNASGHKLHVSSWYLDFTTEPTKYILIQDFFETQLIVTNQAKWWKFYNQLFRCARSVLFTDSFLRLLSVLR